MVRSGARVVAFSVLVTVVVAGTYLMIFGRGGASAQIVSPGADAGSGALSARPITAPTPTASPTPSPNYASTVRAARAKLPTGTLTATTRRSALLKYDSAIGLALGSSSSPVTAAQSACTLLGQGTAAAELADGIVTGAKSNGVVLNQAQSRAFLLGATTLYCPKYASRFQP